jgi:hypothetical protein
MSAPRGKTLSTGLKSEPGTAEGFGVQITIPCHHCSTPKRPLATCPLCTAPVSIDADLSAWRLALHAHHLARITAVPAAVDTPSVSQPSGPMRVVVHTADVKLTPEPSIAVAAVTEPLFGPGGPRSFDWDEGGRRLRRSA